MILLHVDQHLQFPLHNLILLFLNFFYRNIHFILICLIARTRKHLRCNLLFGLIGHFGLLKDMEPLKNNPYAIKSGPKIWAFICLFWKFFQSPCSGLYYRSFTCIKDSHVHRVLGNSSFINPPMDTQFKALFIIDCTRFCGLTYLDHVNLFFLYNKTVVYMLQDVAWLWESSRCNKL